MGLRDQVAVCTNCGWLGTEIEEFEGHEACPECLSAVEWEDASQDDPEDIRDLLEDPVYDMPRTRETFLERHWHELSAGAHRRPSRPQSGFQSLLGHGTVTASRPRQTQLKAALSACHVEGEALLRHPLEAQRDVGRTLLRATGRVCLTRGDVHSDPVER